MKGKKAQRMMEGDRKVCWVCLGNLNDQVTLKTSFSALKKCVTWLIDSWAAGLARVCFLTTGG